jgi:hypothetical protein
VTDGSVLRRGYVPVEPDTSGFDDKLKEQFRKQDPGGKAGKQLGGQLNRALKRLDLAPIDVSADPKKALAAIQVAEARLKGLSANAESVEVKVKTEQAIAQLNRFKRQLGDTGREGGNELGGQLNRALAGLDLAAIDVTADPRSALAAIEKTEDRLKDLGENAESVEVKVKTEQAISELNRFKRQLGDVGEGGGEQAASGFVMRFVARLGPLMASAPISPVGAALGAALGVGAAGVLGAAISGAVVGGAGLQGVLGGVTLAARDQRVKDAGKELGRNLLADLTNRSSVFVGPVLAGIKRIRQGFGEIGPDIDRIFTSSRFVEPLANSGVKAAKGFLSGFAAAVERSEPAVNALSNLIVGVSTATGDALRLMSQDADEGASAINDLTTSIVYFIDTTAGVVHATAQVKGFSDNLDRMIDSGRYWLETLNNSGTKLEEWGVQLDLTADGFQAGSREAEAYAAATRGMAAACEFATLKAAGMTDAEIAAADASGTYRAQLDELRASAQQTSAQMGILIATENDIKDVQTALTQAQTAYNKSIELMAPGVQRATMLTQGLEKATEQLYGAQEAGIDANESYQSSWDSLSEAVKANGRSLDIHTAKGRTNRDALQGLLSSSRDLYYADINSGKSTDAAARAHQRRTEAVRKEAVRVGLNKTETDKLIKSYGRIPPKRQTDIVQQGVDKVVRAMMDLYVYQRSLAEGLPIGSVRAILKNEKGPAKRYGGYHDGGWTGAGGEHEPAGVVHRDEYVIKKSSRRKIEAKSPGLLAEMNATGQLPGYAGGGWVGAFPVDTRKFRVKVTGRETDVPSRAEVASKVQTDFSALGDSISDGIVRAARALVPGIRVLSKDRPGARTLSGNTSYHARRRAVDFDPSEKLARLWNARYMRQTKELISPYQQYNIHNGKRHTYTGRVWRQHNFAGGNAHDHIAMANGGVIREPVAGVGIRSGNSYSFGERGPETVTPGVSGPAAGPLRLHPADIDALAMVISREMSRAVGAGNYAAGRAIGLYTRGG